MPQPVLSVESQPYVAHVFGTAPTCCNVVYDSSVCSSMRLYASRIAHPPRDRAARAVPSKTFRDYSA